MAPEARPRLIGEPRPDRDAVVVDRFGESHRDAGADRSGKPDQQRRSRILGGEGGGEDRRQGRHRAVHQAGQAGLDPGQDHLAPRLLVLGFAGRVGQVPRLGLGGHVDVAPLLAGKPVEQPLRLGIAGPRRRVDIEAARVGFHVGGLLADAIDPQVLNQPDRTAGKVAGDVLAPDQGNRIAESPTVLVDQRLVVPVLLAGHLLEHGRGRWIVGPQAVGIVPVDPGIVLLGGYRQGENLLLPEFGEPAPAGKEKRHRLLPWCSFCARPSPWPRPPYRGGPAGREAPGTRQACAEDPSNSSRTVAIKRSAETGLPRSRRPS